MRRCDGVDCCSAAASPISTEIGDQQGAAATFGSTEEFLAHLDSLGGVDAKLAAHDEYAKSAIRYLIDWLRDEPEPLLAMARGRHAEGHYRHQDSLMFEYSQNELTAEAAQELADAICYIALMLQRA